jgi:LysM repeat protein
MNTSNSPSPLVPQGSLLEKNAGRSRVKLAFFCVVGVHVAGLLVLLMQGCKREPTPQPDAGQLVAPQVVDTNVPVDVVGVTGNPPVDVVGSLPPVPPVPPDPTPTLPPPTSQEYVVQSGDSFSTIAKKFPGVTAKAIQDANPTASALKLQIGQKLTIPAPVVKAPSNGTGTEVVAATGETIHIVKSNETLDGIARKYKTTIKAIQEANNIADTDVRKIQVGRKLKIPGKAAPPPAPQ